MSNSTHTDVPDSTLTLKDIVKCRELMTPRRRPVFHYSAVVSEITHGEGIDKIMKLIDPNFDSDFHKAFLVPIEHRDLVENIFGKGRNHFALL